jgi:hypothetical protein
MYILKISFSSRDIVKEIERCTCIHEETVPILIITVTTVKEAPYGKLSQEQNFTK